MRKLIFPFFIILFMMSCKSDSASKLDAQDQDSGYHPYLHKEQIIYDKDSVRVREIIFLEKSLKSMTDYYGDGKSVRVIKYFKNDLQDGKTTAYFPDGKIKEVQYYKDGNQIGQDTIFFETGEVHFIYPFENNKKNGWMYRYDIEGRQEFGALYKDDKVLEVVDSLDLRKK